MSLDKQIILMGCTGVIAIYSLIVLICGPVRTRGYKSYQSYLKNQTLYKEKDIEKVWKRDKRKLSNLKGFETSAFIIDLLLSLACCTLLILFQIGRIQKEMLLYIIYAGFIFILIAFIFQFAYIWLLGSVFYRHFYDAKYKYDYYYNISGIDTGNKTLIELNDIFKKAKKTATLMATSLPFGILFLLIIAATGYYYYLYYDENYLNTNSERNNRNKNEKDNNNKNNNIKNDDTATPEEKKEKPDINNQYNDNI